MNGAQVCGLFNAPSREDALFAISRAVLRIKADTGETYTAIGKVLDCSADTLERAANEQSLLNADTLLRIQFHFPEAYQFVEQIATGSIAPRKTAADRFDLIERQIDALRKELAR